MFLRCVGLKWLPILSSPYYISVGGWNSTPGKNNMVQWYVILNSLILSVHNLYIAVIPTGDETSFVRFYIPYMMCMYALSRVQLFATAWTVVRQAPLSMEFFSQEYRSGLLPFPSPGDRPHPEMGRSSLALTGGFFTTSATRWTAWRRLICESTSAFKGYEILRLYDEILCSCDIC